MELKVIDMSEEPKKTRKYITRYEQIYQKLAKITNVYLNLKDEESFEKFILKEKRKNQTNLENSLIELPLTNIKRTIKEQYISEPINSGEIGTIDSENQSYEIRNIALLMLMSNRLSKEYKYMIEKSGNIDESKRDKYIKNKRDLLIWKDNATSDLIASLYVLEKTGEEEYRDLFMYGERMDDNNISNFVIDLPYIGQMSVHFGKAKDLILEEAKNKAMSILERKRELGQIDEKALEQLKEELNANKVLPKYEGKLYEYASALPIEYIGTKTKAKISEIGLDTKLPEEIDKKDIQKMQENGLNAREAYYLAIKLGCPKKQLKEVIEVYNQREIPTETKIGRKAVRMTTAEERAKILQFEQRNIQRYRAQGNNRAIGG